VSTTTALQMVNRFMRKYRLDVVADFSSPEALAALDCINDAKEEVLDSRSWQFDEREETLSTMAVRTGVDTLTFTNGSSTASGPTTDATTFHGDYSVRCVPSGSDDRSQTASRANGVTIAFGTLSVGLDDEYSGATTAADVAVDCFAAEYQFPSHDNGDSKVKQLLSMTHQERPLRLVEIDKNFRFDFLVSRLHDSLGDDPATVYVGKPVYDTSSDATNPTNTLRDGFIIWPVPTASERLDITYRHQHETLDAVGDTLENVPDRVINCIVELAFGFSLNTKFGNDPEMAQRVIGAALIRIDRLHRADRKMPYKAKPVRSLDDRSRGRHYTGRRISNDLITGW